MKTIPVANPAATGGIGNTFEHAVGAYWLSERRGGFSCEERNRRLAVEKRHGRLSRHIR